MYPRLYFGLNVFEHRLDTIEASCVYDADSIDVHKNAIETLQKSMQDVNTERVKLCQFTLMH